MNAYKFKLKETDHKSRFLNNSTTFNVILSILLEVMEQSEKFSIQI